MRQNVHSKKKILMDIFQKMFDFFGPQHWWPASSPFEVAVGAILTQNTNWRNVEKAIENLKKNNLMTPEGILETSESELKSLIKSAGYYTQKAHRLKEFCKYLKEKYNGDIEKMRQQDISKLRNELLSIKGIGKETADSILLYALEKPVFVVDAYTYRVLYRHRIVEEGISYDGIQELFHDNIENNAELFNEYHALLVKTGKEYCKKSLPRCSECPLKEFLNGT